MDMFFTKGSVGDVVETFLLLPKLEGYVMIATDQETK